MARHAENSGGSGRVLLVLPALEAGGVEHVVVEIAEALAGAGLTGLVASAGGGMVDAIERAGLRHVRLPLDRRGPGAIWRNAGALARLIADEHIALVHAHSRAPAWSAWLACRRSGAHFVTSYHSPYNEAAPGKRAYNAVMAKGERVIAVSHYLAELIGARHATEPARLRVIPNGVDPARFDPAAVGAERLAAIRAAWNVPPTARIFLLPGRLTGWKGQRVLIAALARLARHDTVGVLVGAEQGRHHYVAELRALAASLGVADRLRIPGPTADMPAALLAADIVLNASTDPEGFGRTIIEAQAMGRIVIAADHGAARETVREGETGFRVPPGDAAALAAALDAALALPEAARAALGTRARAVATGEYSIAAMQAAHLAVYRELLA